MSALAAVVISGCFAVSPASDRVTAGDFAAAIAGLAVPAPDAPVALAPAPGVQRVFHVPELRRLALAFHWDVEPSADVCIERPVAPPDPAQFLDVMRKAYPSASITIVDYARRPLPPGELEFPAAGLHAGGSEALWNGSVRYAGNRRFATWARVKVTLEVRRVIAAEGLRPGTAIAAGQLRVETRHEFPTAAPFLDALDGAVGKLPRAAIAAGSALTAAMLEDRKEVQRGDTVTVDVQQGATHLAMEARAEASGSIGQTIPVSNPESHKRFLARVEGKGKVSVGPRINP